MKRRAFLGWAAAAAPFAALGQGTTRAMPRVALVRSGDEVSGAPGRDAFFRGMREAGHTEGVTYAADLAYARGEGNMPELLRRVVASRPDVIVVGGLVQAVNARKATPTIPIVVFTASDPVAAGLVKSLARPGGNITGLGDSISETTAKRVELLREILPGARSVLLLAESVFPLIAPMVAEARAAAERLGLRTTVIEFADRAALMRAAEGLASTKAGAAMTLGSSVTINSFAALVGAANAARMPLVHYWIPQAEAGPIATYGADVMDNMRRVGRIVDRIFKGTPVGDIPFEINTRFEMVVSRKVATAFGVSLPQSVLLRADRVIE